MKLHFLKFTAQFQELFRKIWALMFRQSLKVKSSSVPQIRAAILRKPALSSTAQLLSRLEHHQSQLITILFASHRLLGTITFVFGQILSNYLSLGRCWVKTSKPHLGTQDSIHHWGSLCSGNRWGSHTPHLHTRRFPYRTRTADMALGSTCLYWRRSSHFLCRCLN